MPLYDFLKSLKGCSKNIPEFALILVWSKFLQHVLQLCFLFMMAIISNLVNSSTVNMWNPDRLIWLYHDMDKEMRYVLMFKDFREGIWQIKLVGAYNKKCKIGKGLSTRGFWGILDGRGRRVSLDQKNSLENSVFEIHSPFSIWSWTRAGIFDGKTGFFQPFFSLFSPLAPPFID